MNHSEKKELVKNVFTDIISKITNIPSDVYFHVIIPYLFVSCEKCKNYLTDKEWNRLMKGELHLQYIRCNNCLLKCNFTRYNNTCKWRGIESEFINTYCINHWIESEYQSIYDMIEEGGQDISEDEEDRLPDGYNYPQVCRLCRKCIDGNAYYKDLC